MTDLISHSYYETLIKILEIRLNDNNSSSDYPRKRFVVLTSIGSRIENQYFGTIEPSPEKRNPYILKNSMDEQKFPVPLPFCLANVPRFRIKTVLRSLYTGRDRIAVFLLYKGYVVLNANPEHFESHLD